MRRIGSTVLALALLALLAPASGCGHRGALVPPGEEGPASAASPVPAAPSGAA